MKGHSHGPECGHDLVPHGDHFDYLVDDRLHHVVESGCCPSHTSGGLHTFSIVDHGSVKVRQRRRPEAAAAAGTDSGNATIITKMFAGGICCPMEAQLIHALLDKLPGEEVWRLPMVVWLHEACLPALNGRSWSFFHAFPITCVNSCFRRGVGGRHGGDKAGGGHARPITHVPCSAGGDAQRGSSGRHPGASPCHAARCERGCIVDKPTVNSFAADHGLCPCRQGQVLATVVPAVVHSAAAGVHPVLHSCPKHGVPQIHGAGVRCGGHALRGTTWLGCAADLEAGHQRPHGHRDGRQELGLVPRVTPPWAVTCS